MKESLTCWQAIELYEEYVRTTHPHEKAERILNGTSQCDSPIFCPTARFQKNNRGEKDDLG